MSFCEQSLGRKIENQAVKLEIKENSLSAHDMIVYVENPKESTRNLLGPINGFSKVAGHKINMQKSVVFLAMDNPKGN